MRCRHCNSDLKLPLVDLGTAPPSNAYLTEGLLHSPEKWYPLRVLVCEQCWLAQTEDFAQAHELFDSEYAYFSGFSTDWLAHCERYVDDMKDRFNLNTNSHVVEVAANDGTLLQYVMAHNISCTGIEPTTSTATAARDKGIPVIEDFFGIRLANELDAKGVHADLTVANNVLAHVPDINDFVKGFAILLKPNGVATFEFPHLLKLIAQNQFDTIYHEHFSYLSLTAVKRIFAENGLSIFDVEEHPMHGGSLRVFAQRIDMAEHPLNKSVDLLIQQEEEAGINTSAYYTGFQEKTNKVKYELLEFLMDVKRNGKSVVAYGAAAKGNTLLNYAGIRSDLITYVVDRNPAKQGKYMPGSRIPIRSPEGLDEDRPDYLLILPWNIAKEVRQQNEKLTAFGTKFVTAVPTLTIF